MASLESLAAKLDTDPEFRKLPQAEQDAVFAELAKDLGGSARAPATVLPSYEQARLRTEQSIGQRPSSINYLREVAQNPQLAQQHPFRTALSAVSAPFEAGESIPANIGLALQRGDVRQLPQELWQGLSGERPAQIGDIYRASGVPPLQAMAAPAGLLLTGGTGGLKNRLATPPQNILDAVMRPALRSAQAIRSTTAAPSMATQQVLGQVPKVAGTISASVMRPLKRSVEPMTEFPYRKSMEVRQGLIGYFRKINDRYGEELEKLSQNLQGVVPTHAIRQAFLRRLQEAGVLDQAGQVVPARLEELNRIERQLLDTYETLGTATSPTVPFTDVIGRLRELRGLIRQQARQRNVPINADERVVSGLLHDMGLLIQPNATGTAAQSLEQINKSYATQRQVFDQANRLFKAFRGEYDTKSSERVMTNFYQVAADGGTQKLMQEIEQVTGVRFIDAAKARSAISDIGHLPGLPQSIRAMLGLTRLAGLTTKAVSKAPFTAQGQVQQATIRELLKMVSQAR